MFVESTAFKDGGVDYYSISPFWFRTSLFYISETRE